MKQYEKPKEFDKYLIAFFIILHMSKFRPINADDVEYYTVSPKPSSLIEYLRMSTPQDKKGDGFLHRKVSELIRIDPSKTGLEACVDLFEERLFANRQGHPLCCPDFIAFNGEYWIIEIGGLGTNLNIQLENDRKIIEINFGIRPKLISVHYSGEFPAIELHYAKKTD